MKRCTIHHSGVFYSCEAVFLESGLDGASDHMVLVDMKVGDGNPLMIIGGKHLYVPEDEMWWVADDCNHGLTQFEVDGKWGFAHVTTGKVIIEPIWDFVSPFYGKFAMVVNGCELDCFGGHCRPSGGKYGFINKNGETVIPLRYDDAGFINQDGNFIVKKDEKWGVIDEQENIIVSFLWSHIDWNYEFGGYVARVDKNEEDMALNNLAEILLNNGEGWRRVARLRARDHTKDLALIDYRGNILVNGLSESPTEYHYAVSAEFRKRHGIPCNERKYSSCFLLRKGNKYGVAHKGRLLREPCMSKKDAVALILKVDWDEELHRYAMIHNRAMESDDPEYAKSWERIPEEIREDVFKYMELHGMKAYQEE